MARVILVVSAVVTLGAVPVFAQEPGEPVEDGEQEPGPEPETESEPERMFQESTLDACRDGADNDGDGHVDCDDQDCGIYAICVKQPAPEQTEIVEPAPETDKAGPGEEKAPGQAKDEVIHRPFSLGFVPGLTTDGGADGPTRNNFSLNFIGWGDYLHGAELGYLGNIRKRDVRGFEAAGLFNHVQGKYTGFQGAGIYNYANLGMRGFQAAGIASITRGGFTGFQAAGIADVATGDFTGFQAAGIAAFDRGSFTGFQAAGIASVIGGAHKGFQAAGIASVTGGHHKGFQAAGITNFARSSRGAQISGIANVAPGDVTGLQASLVNVGGAVRGAQIGLVNIATKEMNGATIGLINYAADGMLAPALWGSDNSMLNIGLKMGSRHVYSILGYGLHPLGGEDERRDSLITGIGGHIDLDPVWIEIDLVSHWLHADFGWGSGDRDWIHKLRATVGYRVVSQLSLFAGPTLNLMVSEVRDQVELIPEVWSDTVDDGDVNLSISIGFIAGLQWEPRFGKLNTR